MTSPKQVPYVNVERGKGLEENENDIPIKLSGNCLRNDIILTNYLLPDGSKTTKKDPKFT